MLSTVTSNAIGHISAQDIQTMDITTLMMLVQAERVDMLDAQLRQQLEEVQARNVRNQQLTELLDMFSAMSKAISGDSSTKTFTKEQAEQFNNEIKAFCDRTGFDFASLGVNKRSIDKLEAEINKYNDQIAAVKSNPAKSVVYGSQSSIKTKISNAKKEIATLDKNFTDKTTRGDLELAINKVKGMMDTNNSSNQMDMLRLQQLTSKRNESFELMTNFAKKMSDSSQSIISNMR